MSEYKSNDGLTVTNDGKGYMGIHSTCVFLNQTIEKNIELQKKLDSAIEVFENIGSFPHYTSTLANEWLKQNNLDETKG